MRKYNLKRDLAYYIGALHGYREAFQLVSSVLTKQITNQAKKVEELQKELEKE